MAETATVGGLGITLSMNATAIGNINSIKGPNVKVNTRDIKHLANTFMKVRRTMIDPGEVSFELEYNKTGHAAIIALLANTTTEREDGQAFIITLPNDDLGTASSIITFTAILTEISFDGMDPENAVKMNVTVKLNSLPAFT